MDTNKRYTMQEIYTICQKHNITPPTMTAVASYVPKIAEMSTGCKAFFISKHRGKGRYYYMINYVNN